MRQRLSMFRAGVMDIEEWWFENEQGLWKKFEQSMVGPRYTFIKLLCMSYLITLY